MTAARRAVARYLPGVLSMLGAFLASHIERNWYFF